MKTVSAIVAVSMFLLVGCKKDMTPAGKASFNFRGDTTSVFRMATYDTCTLFSVMLTISIRHFGILVTGPYQKIKILFCLIHIPEPMM